MVRLELDRDVLETAIRKIDAEWFEKAAAKTSQMIRQGRYLKEGVSWTATKAPLRDAQFSKCAFCERPLVSDSTALLEYDIEHFRPKNTVKPWPDPKRHPTLKYQSSMGGGYENGYFWLALNIDNYLVACKQCNTSYKASWFPVAAQRGSCPDLPEKLATERAWLCNPLSKSDTDPESLIEFVGTVARPVSGGPQMMERAQVIIDFFGLNRRRSLHLQRCWFINMLGSALHRIHNNVGLGSDQKLVMALTLVSTPHASCLRSFKRLWDQDYETALNILEDCNQKIINNPKTFSSMYSIR